MAIIHGGRCEMVVIPKNVIQLIASSDSSKMIATINVKGIPNVIPLWSIVVIDSQTIAFPDVFIKRTKENLIETKKVAIAVCKGNEGYQLKGTFCEFKTSGPVFEEFAKNIMTAMKLQIKGVAIIKIDEVFDSSPGKGSKKLA